MGSQTTWVCHDCHLDFEESDTSMLLLGVPRVIASAKMDACPRCQETITSRKIDQTIEEGESFVEPKELQRRHEGLGEEVYRIEYDPCPRCGGKEHLPVLKSDSGNPICPRCGQDASLHSQVMLD